MHSTYLVPYCANRQGGTKPVKCTNMIQTRNKDNNWIDYPCGQCLACRITRRQEWTFRLMLEMRQHTYCYFVTLTYANEYLPNRYIFGYKRDGTPKWTGSLCKEDLTNYLKRLRYKVGGSKNLRFYAVGEYGKEKASRPHYHLLIFSDKDFKIKFGRDKKGKVIITNSLFHNAWFNDSIVDIAIIPSSNDCGKVAAYVAGYVVKKLTTDENLHKEYGDLKNQAEFSTMSKNPGIGFNQIKYIAKSLNKYSVGPKYTNSNIKNDIQMFRYGGKMWPLSRTLKDRLIKLIGGDHRTDNTKEIQYDQKARELNRRLLDPTYKAEFDKSIIETQERAKARLKRFNRGKQI